MLFCSKFTKPPNLGPPPECAALTHHIPPNHNGKRQFLFASHSPSCSIPSDMNLEPIKAIFGPEVTWQDNIGNGMALGRSAAYQIDIIPDKSVRILCGDAGDTLASLLDHLTGDANASRDFLKTATEFADPRPTLPYFQHIGNVGLRFVRRVGAEPLSHELYIVLPSSPA